MGNFTVGHATSIQIDGTHLRLRYRLDLAEVPTAEKRLGDLKTPAQIQDYLNREVPKLIAGQTLRINGRPVELELIGSDLTQRPGAGDLPTALLNIDCMATVGTSVNRIVLDYEDTNLPTRNGWREINVRAWTGWAITESDVPNASSTDLFENYPTNIDAKTPNQRTARVVLERSTGVATAPAVTAPTTKAAPPPASITPRDRFTELLGNGRLSAGALILAFGVAFVMGCFHALSPGHGKTVVAAYLVGSHGTPGHAVLLGAVVTFTHVAGVIALGLAVLFATGDNVSETASYWLEFVSGLLIASIGIWQFTRRLGVQYAARRQLAQVSSFVPMSAGANIAFIARPSSFTPVLHEHHHGPGGHTHDIPDRITVGGLIALGVSGGIVPCPSALVVMLSAISLHRAALGLGLIVAFSIGLAMVLIAIGLLMLYARRLLDRFASTGAWMKKVSIVSAAVIALIGIGLAAQAMMKMTPLN